MADFEFFKKEFEFRGKHARMAQELWISNDYEHTYFKRLMDLYLVAAVVGFRVDRKAQEDYSPIEPKSIFPDQMIKEKENLEFIMQMMIMLENRGRLSDEECVKKALHSSCHIPVPPAFSDNHRIFLMPAQIPCNPVICCTIGLHIFPLC